MGKRFNLDDAFREGAKRHEFKPTPEDWIHARHLIEQHEMSGSKRKWSWSAGWSSVIVILLSVLFTGLFLMEQTLKQPVLQTGQMGTVISFQNLQASLVSQKNPVNEIEGVPTTSGVKEDLQNDLTDHSISRQSSSRQSSEPTYSTPNEPEVANGNRLEYKNTAERENEGPESFEEIANSPEKLIANKEPVNLKIQENTNSVTSTLINLQRLNSFDVNRGLNNGLKGFYAMKDSLRQLSRKNYLSPTWSFNIYLGGQFWKNNLANKWQMVPKIQLGAGYFFHPRFSVEAGIGYFTSEVNDISRESDSSFYDFGVEHHHYKLTVDRLHYLQVPIVGIFHLNAHHQVSISAETSYLLAANGSIEKTRWASLKEFSTETKEITGQIEGLNPWHYQVGIGYQFRVNDFLTISSGYKLQVNDVLEDGLFRNTRDINLSGVSMGLQYVFK